MIRAGSGANEDAALYSRDHKSFEVKLIGTILERSCAPAFFQKRIVGSLPGRCAVRSGQQTRNGQNDPAHADTFAVQRRVRNDWSRTPITRPTADRKSTRLNSSH